MWGAAPHPGREKFSLHPRHVCDVPHRRLDRHTGDSGAPLRATNGCLVYYFFRPHRRQGRQPRLQPLWFLQASKPLSFQASNCPCTPGTSATCQKDSAVGHIGRIGHIGRRLTPLAQRLLRRALVARSLFSVLCGRGRFGALRLHAPFSKARQRLLLRGVGLFGMIVSSETRDIKRGTS